jgi:cellulose synthase operon protein C
LKWFRKSTNEFDELSRPVKLTLAAAVSVGALACLAAVANPVLVLGPGNGLESWLTNTPSGSAVEQALYRAMRLPGGDILFRRPARETRPELNKVMQASPSLAALYSLRAMEDERAQDFAAAEQDWKTWSQKADDKAGANLDLADFYERRLRPRDELAVLAVVGESPQQSSGENVAATSDRAWKVWERSLTVIDRYALPRSEAVRVYAGWEKRYPHERDVYQKELDFDLAGKDYSAAEALIGRYHAALPQDAEFPVVARASLESARTSPAAGAAVYEGSFEPFWPASLVDSYMNLLTANQGARKAADALHARLMSHPEGGSEALKDAARLFYLKAKEGKLDDARRALADYRSRKEARNAPWSAEELYTLGRLLEQSQDFQEAARYYYALAAQKATPADEERGLAGLARILLAAPEQPLRLGAGNLALYKNIATIDRGPGFWNGILSLWLNTQNPSSEYAQQDQVATPYFHRAKAAELVAEIDQRFPAADDRPELHARLMDAYAAYGEDAAIIREAMGFLAQFKGDSRRVDVALTLAGVYSRTNQTDKEIALYTEMLKELAANAGGNSPIGSNSSEYQKVLDQALARLVQLNRLPDALALLRAELDRNPANPALYDKLASFLEQNRLDEHEDEVYQRAIAQFQSGGAALGWYEKLARFYLRRRRSEEYRALTTKITDIFTGTELENYLKQAPAPDASLALEVERYAHARFPHDLTFVHSLLSYYRAHKMFDEAEKLLWEHWWEESGLREDLFATLSREGKLDAQLELLKQQSPEIGRGDWNGLARTNPAAERFWLESCLWQSRYEDSVGAAEALSAEYASDVELGETAASLERSLAYFHPEDTDKAVAIETRLLQSDPSNLDRMARIGDIYADRGRMSEAAPYWLRMAEAHPGDSDGYLQSATVFWDYFDFQDALTQLQKGRERLAQPALFGYEAGAIRESLGDMPGAVKEYAASAMAGTPSPESRSRLLVLSRRGQSRSVVEAETAELLGGESPAPAAITLRADVLGANHRSDDLKREMQQAIARTSSFAVLDSLSEAARTYNLPAIQEAALRRQIDLTEDPVHKIELRYQLVTLIGQRDSSAAAAEVDAVYRDHPRILGVVRYTVDYDWDHQRKPQAIGALEQAAQAAYPDLRDRFELEVGRKLTETGDYGRARQTLEALLERKPMDASVEAALGENYARSGDNVGLEAFYTKRLSVVKAAPLDRSEKTARLAQLRRGVIAADKLTGKWDEATDQYIELINAYPGDTDLIQEAALTAGAHSEREKLAVFYRKTTADAPQDARWAIVLGQIETALEDFPAAIDAYGKAIRVRPEQKDLYQSRAALEERLHRLDDAAADYQKLYALSYHDPAWELKIAEARARQGRNADAVHALEEAWIAGKPATAANDFRIAAKLEEWGLLDEARARAEQGADLAGPAWLIDPAASTDAPIYARIMARLRRSDDAFARLAAARMQVEKLETPVGGDATIEGIPGAVTPEQWRRRFQKDRAETARQTFAQSLAAMGSVAGVYYTPEERVQFAAWLKSKLATAVDGSEMRVVYLPAIQAAGLKEMEADLLWEFAAKNSNPGRHELPEWLKLEVDRMQLDGVGEKMEKLADGVDPRYRAEIWAIAANFYQSMGDRASELRMFDKLATASSWGGTPRYYELLLSARPQTLLSRARADEVAQFVLANGSADQAFAAIETRSSHMPAVWKSAYTGLTGLYLRDHRSAVRQAFQDALAPERTIGERMDHPTDRDKQLAGDLWFYYSSRYGEYLDELKDTSAESFLEAELEHAPSQGSSYSDLAEYLASAGRADSALADYQHALDLKRDQPAVLAAMAELHWKQYKKEAALGEWKQAVKLLAQEIDAKPVPETFWDDFARVLESASAHGSYAAISEDVDALLQVYIRRNGEFRAEPLLEAGYKANGSSLAWVLVMASAAADPTNLLTVLRQSTWIESAQRSELLQRAAEVMRSKSDPTQRNYELENVEAELAGSFLRDGKPAAARAVLEQVSSDVRKEGQWVALTLQLTEAEGNIPQLVTEWRRNPDAAPSTENLQAAAGTLKSPAKRAVMRFVYERALDERQLTAANFLGLAAIDLDENKKDAALELLKRLTLAGSDLYGDTNSVATLLESRGLYSETTPFLETLAEAFPWQAGYRVRLAAAQLKAAPGNTAALAALVVAASDSEATYADRLRAAEAMQGRGPAATRSTELDLVARGSCISMEQANRPYFVEARLAAASCSKDERQRETLLRAAIGDAPNNESLRVRYVLAAFATQMPDRALIAFGPLKEVNLFGSAEPQDSSDESNGDQSVESAKQSSAKVLTPQENHKLVWDLIHVHERRGETTDALELLQQALMGEMDAAHKQTLTNEQNKLNEDLARQDENASRAPKIQDAVEQDHVVRPRLLPGMALPPKKKAATEEESE